MLFQEFSAWKVLSSICSLLVAPGLLKLMCRIWAHCSQYLWTPLADDLIKCSYWTISDQLLKKELGGGGSREKPHRQWDLVYRPEESLQGLNWEVCHDGNLCLGICHSGVGFVPWIPLRCDHNFFFSQKKSSFYYKMNKKRLDMSVWNLEIHFCGFASSVMGSNKIHDPMFM